MSLKLQAGRAARRAYITVCRNTGNGTDCVLRAVSFNLTGNFGLINNLALRLSIVVRENWKDLRQSFENTFFAPFGPGKQRLTTPGIEPFYRAWDDARTRAQKQVKPNSFDNFKFQSQFLLFV